MIIADIYIIDFLENMYDKTFRRSKYNEKK